MTMTKGFLLDWLSKEDSSLYGECRGYVFDELLAEGLVMFVGHNSTDENYSRVALTDAGRKSLSDEGGQ